MCVDAGNGEIVKDLPAGEYRDTELEYLKESKLAYIFGSTLFVDDAVFEQYMALPGLQWEEVDSVSEGLRSGVDAQMHQLSNETLAARLQEGKRTFTKPELDKMGVSTLSLDQYVHAGGKFFRPATLQCRVKAVNKEWADLVSHPQREPGTSILIETGLFACFLLTFDAMNTS